MRRWLASEEVTYKPRGAVEITPKDGIGFKMPRSLRVSDGAVVVGLGSQSPHVRRTIAATPGVACGSLSYACTRLSWGLRLSRLAGWQRPG